MNLFKLINRQNTAIRRVGYHDGKKDAYEHVKYYLSSLKDSQHYERVMKDIEKDIEIAEMAKIEAQAEVGAYNETLKDFLTDEDGE